MLIKQNNFNVKVVSYLIKLGPRLIELLVVDGILQGTPHFIPLLILSKFFLLLL